MKMCEAVKTQWLLQGQDWCSLGRIKLLLSWRSIRCQCPHWHAGAAGLCLWSRRKRFAVPGGGSSLGSGSMCRPVVLEIPVPRKISWPYFLQAFGGQDSPSGFLHTSEQVDKQGYVLCWSWLPAPLHPPAGSEICVLLPGSGHCISAPWGWHIPCSQPLEPAWPGAGGGCGFGAGKDILWGSSGTSHQWCTQHLVFYPQYTIKTFFFHLLLSSSSFWPFSFKA